MNKKASMELGINFIVVLIICIVLLGLGIGIMVKSRNVVTQMKENVDKYHEDQLKKAINDGALTAVYPARLTVERGAYADFSLGISNELGADQDFTITIKWLADKSPSTAAEPEILYWTQAFSIKSNEQAFKPIRISMPKKSTAGSYIFNIYVCKGQGCTPDSSQRYGDLQKIQVNVN